MGATLGGRGGFQNLVARRLSRSELDNPEKLHADYDQQCQIFQIFQIFKIIKNKKKLQSFSKINKMNAQHSSHPFCCRGRFAAARKKGIASTSWTTVSGKAEARTTGLRRAGRSIPGPGHGVVDGPGVGGAGPGVVDGRCVQKGRDVISTS